MKPGILVLCTGNSARSQMGEGLFRHYLGDRFEVSSAGTRPSSVRQEAVAVMAELGIDLTGHRSKSVEEFLDREFRYVFTVCDQAKESCPLFPGQAERIHWSLEDPAAVEGSWEERTAAFREIRDQLRERVIKFAKTV
ncbi:MAG: arsenate reductase ArsC [Bryobacteraceae bacterium]